MLFFFLPSVKGAGNPLALVFIIQDDSSVRDSIQDRYFSSYDSIRFSIGILGKRKCSGSCTIDIVLVGLDDADDDSEDVAFCPYRLVFFEKDIFGLGEEMTCLRKYESLFSLIGLNTILFNIKREIEERDKKRKKKGF